MSWPIRMVDRWTMCRWQGHRPWPKLEDARESTCERCGKRLGPVEPVGGEWQIPKRTL
jgi:hypothetical protein